MHSFSFRMQRLLGFRNIQEEEARRELGQRNMALERETARLSGLEKEEESVIDRWRSQLQESIELPRLQATQDYNTLLENRLAQQAGQQMRSRRLVEEQREIARKCWQQKKILEILQNKAFDEYRRREQVRERNLIDEIVLNTFNRKGGE